MLPALGENAVEQRAVSELVDGVEPELRDPLPVAVLKADLRLAEVIRRAAESRLVSEPVELVLRLEGSFISVRLREVRELLGRAREENGTTSLGRERFRMSLLRRFYEEYGRVLGGPPRATSKRSSRRSVPRGYLDSVLKAAWPLVVPEKLVRSLLSNRTASPRPQTGSSSPTSSVSSSGAARAGRTPTCRSSTRRGRCSRPRRTATAM